VFKIEIEDDRGIWSDVRGDDGRVLTYQTEGAARAALRERFPLVQKERNGDRKRTRIIRILEDDDEDWPKRPGSS
jgi:hypothetical protein